MKNITIKFFIFLLLVCQSCAVANEYDKEKYKDKSYVGMPYNDALSHKKPFLLVFANPNNLFSMLKMYPIAEMVYNDYKGVYNFCVLNSTKEENKILLNLYNADDLPALYIIDPLKKHYIPISQKYHSKKQLKPILEKYQNGF